ncbi:MAG: vWA domain-containing protein [Candidatus Hatepunaea meridiana]|nr:vWA domain-containing protein [Candidatus Hatepunaea meridiana]
MLTETSFKILTNYSLWLVVLGLLAAAGFALWSYRRTVPPTGNWLRGLLTFLRWGALSCGILLIAHPEIEIHRSFQEPADLLVLIDRSSSMGLVQTGSDRVNLVTQLITSDDFKRLEKAYNLRLFGFSDSLESEWNDITAALNNTPDGVGTDLGQSWMQALEEYSGEKPAAILLVSDGAHNMGADPARLARIAHVPIWAIGVGSTQAVKDIMIRSVSVNPVVYQDSKVPVEVGYRGVGASGTKVNVILRDADRKRIAAHQIRFSGDFSETTLMFEIPVKKPGRQKYSVEIERLDDELTYDNNKRSFYLNVLANRMRVLVMTGPPDQGLGDLIRRLKKDDNVELTQRTTKGKGFYEGDWPNIDIIGKTDVLVLHHFPVRSNSKKKLESFVANVVDKELPVAFIDGGALDPNRLKLIEPLLPLTLDRTRVKLLRGQVFPIRRHSVIADPEATDITIGWSDLPPVLFFNNAYKMKPQSTVLAEFVDEESLKRFPAIVISDAGGTKSSALLIRDLWRWGLAKPGDEGVVEPLLERLVRWLAVRKIDKRVKIVFDREIFSNQEQVGFTVIVLDENYLPLDGVNVLAKVAKGKEPGGHAALTGIGQGRYRGSFQSWGEGEYSVSVKATVDEQLIGEDRGTVTAEPFSIELLDTRLNEELMRSIGEASQGGYVSISSADSLLNTFDFQPVDREIVNTIQLWGKGWLLALIIGLLAVEWLIRVRVGML